MTSFKWPLALFRGLLSFREEDAPLFCGREVVTKRIIAKLRDRSIVGIVGASGSGKSSVVFAGVIPALHEEQRWLLAAFRPGVRPFDSLAVALMPLLEPNLSEPALSDATRSLAMTLRNPGGPYAIVEHLVRRRVQPLAIVADQFEELYTNCPDDDERRRFLDVILEISTARGETSTPIKLLLTLRGDFYGSLIAYRPISDILQDAIVHLPPMSRSELRDAVIKPSSIGGITFEDGLVDRILDDVGEEPGNLPLLEFSLMLLWDRQEVGRLTHRAYEGIGRLAGAIASQAEDVYGSLAPEQQDTARQLLTRLVRVANPDEDRNDARRRTRLSEVASLPKVTKVIRALTDARLLVTDADPDGQQTVELAHEAIIREWDRLRSWLVEDRQFLLWQQRARRWYEEWQLSGQEPGALLRGRILSEAQSWIADKGSEAVEPNLLEYINRSSRTSEDEIRQQTLARTEFLFHAMPDELMSIIDSLSDGRQWADQRLREMLAEADSDKRWRARLALLPVDDEEAARLIDEIESVQPQELLIIRDALAPYKDLVLPRLWEIATTAESASQIQFRSAILIASYAPNDSRWPTVAPDVAQCLVNENQLYSREWVEALRPVRNVLFEPLHKLYLPPHREGLREAAAALLLALAEDRPAFLTHLASESMPQNYERMVSILRASTESARIAQKTLADLMRLGPSADASEDQRVAIGTRRAVAACTLLRFDNTDGLEDVLRADPDPETVTQFIHQVRTRGVPAPLLVDMLASASRADVRFALLLALGAFNTDEIDQRSLQFALDRVIGWFHDDPDSGVHSACSWLLRRWSNASIGPTINNRLVPYDPSGQRTWFTMQFREKLLPFAVFSPGDFLMGSSPTEQERKSYESRLRLAPSQRPTRLTRPFAVCMREVTREDFEFFVSATNEIQLPNIDELSPLPTEPQVGATWFEAVDYCNWLTGEIGSPSIQEPSAEASDLPNTTSTAPRSGTIDNCGFRLPSEAEWEYACRAGTITAFSFGSDRSLLDEYGWSASNSALKTHEAEILRPNRAGLFNMHGNCWEWCLDWYADYEPEAVVDPVGPEKGDRRVLRGGCWNLGPSYGRSACRNAHLPTNRNYYIGFRVVCTLPSWPEE